MNRFRALLMVALVSSARVTCCWAAAPVAPAGSPPQVARLPPITPDGPAAAESARPLATEPETANGVSLTAYEDFVVADDTPAAPVSPKATRLFEATWYTRVDSFYWDEQINGATFMQNNGVVPTLGYQQRYGRQRFRAELFGGRVDYFADLGSLNDLNVTDYLGLRGEYEVMFEPQTWPLQSLFAGIGTRFFVRSTPDIILEKSVLIDGYQESWWTFYPYVGVESRRTMKPGWEAYYRTRVGVTAFTWEHVALNDVTLFPRANVTVQSEMGFRGPSWHVSVYADIMAWSPSPKVLAYDGVFLYEVRQPASTNILVGLKTGFSY
jgi:hypothetical protein